jgi:enoyl-CoA hydratase/carnithine racemase
MSLVLTEDRGAVRILSMNNPKANPLNESLVDGLRVEFNRARSDASIRAVVLTSALDGYFSVGLDVREVFDYPRDRMGRFWVAFVELYEGIYDFPKPVVAALTGHTFAGGIILALACDVRVMARGAHGLGVSGINLGLALPRGVMNMAINAVGHGHARRLFLTGETINPEMALSMGLVHELTDRTELLSRTVARAAELGEKSPDAFRTIHRMFDELSGRSELESDKANLDRFLETWFSPAAVATREAVRSRIAGPA